jgi:hypothetical protein
MGIALGIFMILTGAIAAAPLLDQSAKKARQMVDNLAQARGILGILTAIVGLINALFLLGHLPGAGWVFAWLFGMLASGVAMALGFVSGYDLMNQSAMVKRASTSKRGAAAYARLKASQVGLGVASLVLGLIVLVRSL